MRDHRLHIPTVIGTSAFWVLAFGVILLLMQRPPAAQPIQILAPPTVVSDESSATPAPLRVYVSGAVQRPGVYRLPPDSLVDDALSAAGGHNAEADLVAINLAHPLSDGEQIYIPTLDENLPPAALSESVVGSNQTNGSSDHLDQPATLLDLNTATQPELEALPDVGPKTAEAIIAGRPYSTVEDLLRVKGIGDATLEKLRPFVTVK